MSTPGAASFPDAAARLRAATDFTVNLGVTAGAGAGKTSLLIERLLEALLVKGMALDRVVAITFTEKAAAEMRERLLAGLDLVARGRDAAARSSDPAARVVARAIACGKPSLDLLRTRAQQALRATPRIGTLHSFALALLHRHPLEASVPADVSMDLGDGFARHVRAELPALVEAALVREGDHGPAARALHELEIDDLAELVRKLAWLPDAAGGTPPALIAPLFDTIERELTAARPLLPEKQGRAGRLYAHWDATLALIRWVRQNPPSHAKRYAFPPAIAEFLVDVTSGASVPAPGLDLERCREWLILARKRLRRLQALDEPRVAALIDAATPWASELRASFLAGGAISADGALAVAATLLARHPAVRHDEAAGIDALLVDEFQDTDALQRDLIVFLCERADRPPAPRASAVELAPGRLFLVGDPKQSIYRFRGADLDVWQETLTQITTQGGVELILKTSFRSTAELVAPVNHFFAAWRDPENDAEPRFDPLHAARGSDPSSGVERWNVTRPDGDQSAEMRAEAEGRAIAAEIATWVAAPTAGGAPPRRLRDVVILLRRLSALHWFTAPLRERGLPFTVSGGRTFAHRTEVGELASLLLAAADPTNEMAALGALRGGLGSVTDRELLALKQWRGTLSWRRLLDCPLAPARELSARLERLHADLARAPVAAALARFVEQSPLLPIAAFARDGEQRIANVRKLAEQVELRARKYGLPLAEALREVMGLDEATEGESERSLADDELDGVRILTIHKAKGLEFEQVFVPDLAQPRRSDRKLALSVALLPSGDGPRLAVAIEPRAAAASANAAQLLREERDRAHRDAESKRLLYVAMTRAKQRLVLVSAEGGRRGGSFAEALDALLPPEVPRRVVVMPDREFAPSPALLLTTAVAAAAVASFEAARSAARAPAPRFGKPSGHDGDATAATDGKRAHDSANGGDTEQDRDFALLLGDVLHVALAERGPQQPPEPAAIERALATAAAPPRRREALATAARALLTGDPARTLYAKLAHVRTVAIELPLNLWRDGVAWRGAADLVFADGDDLVIGDWKSDRLDDDTALAQRHRAQLHLYRDALAAAWRIAPPRTELLLLRHGRRVVV